MFSKAKVGDRVWSLLEGWGTLVEVDGADRNYPIKIKFDGGSVDWITTCGRHQIKDLNPTVFWDEVEIVPPDRALPELTVDTPVLVRAEGGIWQAAHFADWDGTRIRTWMNGRTSHTSVTKIPYDEWKLFVKEQP